MDNEMTTAHSYRMLVEEKQILDDSHNTEMMEKQMECGPKMLGCIDSRMFLLATTTVSLISNMVNIWMLRDEKFSPYIYGYFSLLTVLGLQGILTKNTLLLCIFGAHTLATSLFDALLCGAALYITLLPTFCESATSILASQSWRAYEFCTEHTFALKIGVLGSVLAVIGFDMLVLAQIMKVYEWGSQIESMKERNKRIAIV